MLTIIPPALQSRSCALLLVTMIAGVMLCHGQAQLCAWWIVATSAIIALCLAYSQIDRLSLLGCLLLAGCAGFGWAQWHAQRHLEQRLPAALIAQSVTLRGDIVSIPQSSTFGTRFLLRPEQSIGSWQPEQIQVNVYGKNPPFKAGERWQFQARLKPVHGQINPSSFDLERWFLQQNIAAIANAKQPVKLAGTHWDTVLLLYRSTLLAQIDRQLGNHPYKGIIKALSIGEQSQISPDQWWRFSQTGVIHLVSISGLHITMLAALAGLITLNIWRRIAWLASRFSAPRAALISGVLSASAYCAISGFSIPTQRTFIMLLIFSLALWHRRQIPISVVWLGAMTAVVLIDPFAILSIGFWLSFLCVGTLFWACAQRIGPLLQWQQWLQSQWAATWVSLPLLLVIFGQFPLISPLANAWAIPVVSLLVTPLALIGLFDPSGHTLSWAASLMSWCDLGLQFLLKWPIGGWQHAPPPNAMLPAALLGVLLLLLPAGFAARYLGLALLMPLLAYAPEPLRAGQFRAVALDVGQGLAVLIQTRQHALLFDTGQASNADRVIMPALRHFNVLRLDSLLLSHNDLDHMGGAALLLQRWPVDALIHSLPEHHPLLTPASKRCQAGMRWQWDGVHFELLWPHPDYAIQTDNARSCVLRVNNGRFSILLTADIGKAEEIELLSHGLGHHSVVFAPHHGSKNSSSMPFIHATSPQYAVFSAGFMNRFGHPKAEVLTRYQAQQATSLQTAELGAIHFELTDQLTIHSERLLHPHYWYTSGLPP
ncbi:DNA internalization-related competence protein ComEC/Rec2 [Chitinibacter sp. S2-10]|uniref:DNA internalization-related competence protein ComEC/Rec2 n=1 Tax=Chitinibacter sp. S2-10 TaxID=3373597 RepID=UPI003977A7DC